MKLPQLLRKNSPYLFFIKFLLAFLVLYTFFYFLWGVTGKGGKMYSSFFDNYFNIIKSLSSFLTISAKFILNIFNYNVNQINYHTLRIDFSRGISVNPDCLGWGIMSFWVAFVFANAGGWIHKIKWMLIGISSVIILNISRIAIIAVSNYHGWKTITSLDHHQTFNVVSYGCIFLLMFLYVKVQKKYETINVDGKN